MSRNLSKYDRLRALVRNPIYLRDLEAFQKGIAPPEIAKDAIRKAIVPAHTKLEDVKIDSKSLPVGFNPRALTWLLDKYKLSIPITRELIEKYPAAKWEQTVVFKDDVITRPVFKKEPSMIELEAGLFQHDYRPCFKDNTSLTLKIDLTRKKREILDKVSSDIDFFRQYTPQSNKRKKHDEKIDRFDVWDKYKITKSFSGIAEELGVDRTTVRKAYLRAFEDIIGEVYDPKKHDRGRIDRVELATTCEKCPKRDTCDTPCPEILAFITQEEVKKRERTISETNLDYHLYGEDPREDPKNK